MRRIDIYSFILPVYLERMHIYNYILMKFSYMHKIKWNIRPASYSLNFKVSSHLDDLYLWREYVTPANIFNPHSS